MAPGFPFPQPTTTGETIGTTSSQLKRRPERDGVATNPAKRHRGDDGTGEAINTVPRPSTEGSGFSRERPPWTSRRTSSRDPTYIDLTGDEVTDLIPNPSRSKADFIDLTDDEPQVLIPVSSRRRERVSTPFPSSSAHNPSEPTRSCAACLDDTSFLGRVDCPCGHCYCLPCLKHLVTVAMRDEAHFPPRCCNIAIPKSTMYLGLSKEDRGKLQDKEVEFGTQNRTYCHKCASFIPPNQMRNDLATCQRCKCSTCVFCKKTEHKGECLEDTATAKLLECAKKNKWQRCPKCRAMIEKSAGCVYMACNCGCNFCYGCGRIFAECLGTCTAGPFTEDMHELPRPFRIYQNRLRLNSLARNRGPDSQPPYAPIQNPVSNNGPAHVPGQPTPDPLLALLQTMPQAGLMPRRSQLWAQAREAFRPERHPATRATLLPDEYRARHQNQSFAAVQGQLQAYTVRGPARN